MILAVAAVVLVIIAGLYAFAPHPPATPARVENVSDLEAYLNRLDW